MSNLPKSIDVEFIRRMARLDRYQTNYWSNYAYGKGPYGNYSTPEKPKRIILFEEENEQES